MLLAEVKCFKDGYTRKGNMKMEAIQQGEICFHLKKVY
jgi:hypothetical protein